MNSFIAAEDLVRALYINLLGREPESGAVESALAGDPFIYDLIKKFVNCDEFRLRYIRDHSQYGEFWKVTRLMFSGSGYVVDVGANGKERSNSYDLIKNFGFLGLLMEANPSLIPGIKADFGEGVAIENCAISDFEGGSRATLGLNTDISSISREATAAWGQVRGSVKVPVKRLAPLLDSHNVPKDFDVLSIDIEGHDVRTLNDLVRTSGYRPRYIVSETSFNFSVAFDSVGFCAEFLDAYELADRTFANMVLRRRSLQSVR